MRVLIFISIILVVTSCKQEQEISFSAPKSISSDTPSGCAYLTKDHQGQPVLCWTEDDSKGGRLYFSSFDTSAETFTSPIAVPPSQGTGLHSESMNKVAFKNDGTVVAVYEKKHPTEQNKYAGSILYTQSFDNGLTWTKEKFLHSDTLQNYSRSFFDIVTLPDGEIGAVWLDGRLQLDKEGSSLFFAKTKGRDGFQQDYQVGETVCECCRTDLFVDDQDKVHIVFRDIESTIEGQVRDFNHIVSANNGVTFSKGEKVSHDKWIVDGCPHTGASMAGTADQLSVCWFTAGGEPGLYMTSSTSEGTAFQPRQLLSANARHPQLASQKNQILGVWNNLSSSNTQDHHNAGHSSHGPAGEISHISFAILNNGKNKVFSIPQTEEAEFPVIQAIDETKAIIAYTKNKTVFVCAIDYQK